MIEDNSVTTHPGKSTDQKKSIWLRLRPLYLIAGAIAVVFLNGWHEYLSLETLRNQRVALTTFVSEHFFLSIAIYLLVYVTATALMLPGALWITISGGFLFGVATGSAGTVAGATIGATALFLAARTSFGALLQEKAGPFLRRMEAGFKDDEISYMFALRFMPVVPFPVANIAPALLGARLIPFIVTTAIGVLPAVVAYTWLGAGLGAAFDAGEELDLAGFFANLAPAFVALGVLALTPPLIKKLTGKTPPKTEPESMKG